MADLKRLDGVSTGELKVDERQFLADELAKRGFNSAIKCELCGVAEWQVGGYIVNFQGLARYDGKYREALADPWHPSCLVLCSNCGNTKVINLGILDLIDRFSEG